MSGMSVGIIDENPILLQALSTICSDKGLGISASGGSAADAIRLAADHQVIILDPTMQGGMEVISEILSRNPSVKVIAYSSALGADYAVRAIEAGARGYILKRCTAAEFISAVNSVINGETYITPSFAATILMALRDDRLRKRAAQLVDFSIRENQIIRLLLRGRTNKEIARTLAISEKTVKCYMTTLMQKLNARNRTEAVLACQRIGLQQDPEMSAH